MRSRYLVDLHRAEFMKNNKNIRIYGKGVLIPTSTSESSTPTQPTIPACTLTPPVSITRIAIPKFHGNLELAEESHETTMPAGSKTLLPDVSTEKQKVTDELTANQEMRTVQASNSSARTNPVQWKLVTGKPRQQRRTPANRRNYAQALTANDRQTCKYGYYSELVNSS
jgi:hypothetical protein